jgi:hypothetical protein
MIHAACYLLYIDPGSGSLFFQMLLSGMLTAIVFLKRIKLYLKFLFSSKSNKIRIDELPNN